MKIRVAIDNSRTKRGDSLLTVHRFSHIIGALGVASRCARSFVRLLAAEMTASMAERLESFIGHATFLLSLTHFINPTPLTMTSFALTHIERTKQPGLALAGARWRAVFGRVGSRASTTVITPSVMSTTGGRDCLPLKSSGAATATGERTP